MITPLMSDHFKFVFQETYLFDFRNEQWLELQTQGEKPAWRDFHTAEVSFVIYPHFRIYQSKLINQSQTIGNRMYIFGGRSDMAGEFHSNRETYYDT